MSPSLRTEQTLSGVRHRATCITERSVIERKRALRGEGYSDNYEQNYSNAQLVHDSQLTADHATLTLTNQTPS